MRDYVLDTMTLDDINAAIDRAQKYADSKGVPLTIERLSVTLGVNKQALQLYIGGHSDSEDDTHKAKVKTLKRAISGCTASVMEHGMMRGNSPVMPIFYLKANEGYQDKVEHEVTHKVSFTGMDSLQD